jgi:uncharacterized membrane protein YhaH (DUF805 family)/Tfp pilus assembly major pilin PilA
MDNPYVASNAEGMPQDTYVPRIFSLSGRLGRLRYLGFSLVLNLIGGIAALVITTLATLANNETVLMLAGLAMYIPMLATSMIVAKRRFNDLNLTGWLSILSVIPLLNLLVFLYLVFAPGDRAPNKYGPPPSPNTTAVIVLCSIFPIIFVIGILAAIALPAYQNYTKKAKFAEVVLATNAAKVGVEICAQDRTTSPNGSWTIRGCGGGNNGVPADVNSPSGFVASVQTADNGIIMATAISEKGLRGETYVLNPTFHDGKITWTVSGTCRTDAPRIC